MQKTDSIEEVITRCNEIFLTKTASEWREFFRENNVASEIMKMSCEVSSDPQAIENGYVTPVEYSVEYSDENKTTVMMPCPPIAFSDYERREYEPTGTIGEHTDEILTSMGYSEGEIKELKKSGSVR